MTNSAPTDPKLHDPILHRIIAAIGQTPGDIYEPREDSFLLLEVVKEASVSGKTILDIGTGSGLLGLYCAARGAIVTLSDINKEALKWAAQAADRLGLEISAVHSDLFDKMPGKFDLILLNPPYLPSSGHVDAAVDGGTLGRSIIAKFLSELPEHLEERAESLLLVSSLNDPSSMAADYPRLSFSVARRKRLFFEELLVVRVRLRRNLTG